MANDRLTVALLAAVFPDREAVLALVPRLVAARAAGAELVVLPELPLHPWLPAGRERQEGDAEAPGGPRHQQLAAAAREAEVALLGGTLVELPGGQRRNRALLFDAAGELACSYDKCHLPDEEGFWECDHYQPGDEPPRPVAVAGFPLGIQLCSDLNRPQLGHALAAAGALAILGPRATEAATWPRWRLVLQATAMTAGAYVLSVTRPQPERGVPLGGPSFVAGPDGALLLESTEPLVLATLERGAVERARFGYPGYLAVRSDLYQRGWAAAEAAERAGGASGSQQQPRRHE